MDNVAFIRFAKIPACGLFADSTDSACVTWFVSEITVDRSDIPAYASIDSIEVDEGLATARFAIRFATDAT